MPIKYSWNTSLSNQENCKCKCALHYCLPCNQLMVQSNFAKCLQICLHLCPWYWNLRMANCSFLAGPGFFLPLPVIVLASGTALGIRGKLSMFILNTGLYPSPLFVERVTQKQWFDYLRLFEIFHCLSPCLQGGLHRGHGRARQYPHLRHVRRAVSRGHAPGVSPVPRQVRSTHRSYSRDPGDPAGY